MKRTFSFADVKRISLRHQEIKSIISEICQIDKKYRKNVEKAADEYINSEIIRLLKDIPVDELNKDKLGIRVKALRDEGIVNYGEIFVLSASRLEDIRGISGEAACLIKEIVDKVAKEVKKDVKLNLSIDKKTGFTNKIVLAISQYHRAKELAGEGRKLFDNYNTNIDNAINDISLAKGFFHWLFLSVDKKQRAVNAYNFLIKTVDGEYGEKSNELLEKKSELECFSIYNAWSEFEKQSIKYINTVEDIVPGLLGNNDNVYGLPKDLANEVLGEEFNSEGLLCELRKYQEWGVRYILHQGRVLLGDEMGLGKTIQAIASMVSLKNNNATHFLVICPASVIINWCREIEKFSKLRVVKVHSALRELAVEDWINNGGVAVTNYESTSYFNLPESFCYDMLVVDEAHYIKNPETKRASNTRLLAESAKYLLFMTGTAIENRVNEMINLIDILQPKIAKKLQGITMLASAPKFRKEIASVYYRRKREDVLTELPDLLENEEWCRMGIEEEIEYENAVLYKNYQKARRVSWNVADLNYSSKANRMLEIIEEAKDEGRKVIIFSFYLDTIDKITKLLGNRCSEAINGSLPPTRRQEIIDEFNNAPAGQVLPAQIIAGGTGLNIQSASVVIICEPQLKPSIEKQAISRAYHMGQVRNVLVYRLLCENTIDERIIELLEKKQGIFDSFADKSVAANMDKLEVDNQVFNDIMQKEIERINKKRVLLTKGNI